MEAGGEPLPHQGVRDTDRFHSAILSLNVEIREWILNTLILFVQADMS